MGFLNSLRFVISHPLNRGSAIAALTRVIRWQIGARLLPGPVGLPFVNGTYLLAMRHTPGATGNWYCGLHEVSEMAFVLHMLRADDLFLDVGANVGSYTVLAAGGTMARVISVEPIPATFMKLQANIAFNAIAGRVEPHCVGLSEGSGAQRFSVNDDTMNHVLAEGEQVPSVDVPVIAMDELLDGRVPLVIKIDVEGHEASVVKGGARTLSHPNLAAVIMEINGSGARYGVADDELLVMMRAHGFEPVGYDAVRRVLCDWDATNGNAIFVRDRAAVASRVVMAPRYQLVNGEI